MGYLKLKVLLYRAASFMPMFRTTTLKVQYKVIARHCANNLVTELHFYSEKGGVDDLTKSEMCINCYFKIGVFKFICAAMGEKFNFCWFDIFMFKINLRKRANKTPL